MLEHDRPPHAAALFLWSLLQIHKVRLDYDLYLMLRGDFNFRRCLVALLQEIDAIAASIANDPGCSLSRLTKLHTGIIADREPSQLSVGPDAAH